MPKISVITPSVRENGLEVVKKSLDNQTEKDFEWLVCSPFEYKEAIWVKEPPKREGDFYGLNKAYNALLKQAKGELIISCQDMLQLPATCLETFWFWHENKNGMACIGAVGDHYLSLDPPVLVWKDPRRTTQYGSFYEINPIDIEFTLCAIPRKAFYDVGGFDEEYDRGAAVGEKELCLRIDKASYRFYIDQSLEYKAIKHPRLTKDWDEYYKIASDLYSKHFLEIQEGKRLKLGYLPLT